MSHIIFYAINGVGLGHIARLSVVQRHLESHNPDHSVEALCRSTMGSMFFTCPCTNVPRRRDLTKALGIRGVSGLYNLLQTRLRPAKRKTVFFDTYWSNSVVKRLKAGGHRTILIMQSFKPDAMFEALQLANRLFDHVFFPCEAEELEYHYKSHPKLWALLQQDKFEALGPFVREADQRDQTEKVIFTLGGGGEHDNEDPAYSVHAYLEQYVETAHILHAAGKTNLYLAKGPLMTPDIDLGPLQVLETMSLPDLFGENTCVVTRGTYNLGWEAMAAGAKLVATTRSAISAEHADSRNQYLASKQYSYCAPLNAKALAKAILQDKPAKLQEATQLVNARQGLSRLTEVICAK